MNVGVLGASHQHASIEELESIYLSSSKAETFIESVSKHPELKELVLVTTCNRMEYYFVSENGEVAAQSLKEEIAKYTGTEKEQVSKVLKFRQKEEAIEHLFSVSSGLKSMVFGENEILAQIKESYERSKEKQGTGPLLNKLFQMAVATGKRVRTETGISKGAYSVSSIAVEAIREKILDYFGRKILIIGMGTMGVRSLKKLAALGHPALTLSNRDVEKAKKQAKEHNATAISLEEALETWANFDIIITATSASEYLIKESKQDSIKTQLIIDLGLPRNVKPRLDDRIELISVEGLKQIAEKNIKKRQVELDAASAIIVEEKEKFMEWKTQREKR